MISFEDGRRRSHDRPRSMDAMSISLRIASIITMLLLLLSCVEDSEQIATGNPATSIETKVEGLLSHMTLDEKIGQMTQVDRGSLQKESDIKDYYLGSLLSGGGSSPQTNTATGWASMCDNFQSYALQTRLKIPLIYGIDAVHGHNNVYGAVIFPHNIGLGCTRNQGLVEAAARATAEEVAGTGINWTFSPCIAVPRDERWGRTYEGFGETPELATMMAAAAVRGYQTKILACAKHYVGDGGTTNGSNGGNTELDEPTLRAIHLPGYIAAVNSGVGSIMVSYSSWNGQKMHGNRYLLTTVLKSELGFKGFLVSDWAAIDQLPGDYSQQVETSINAGLDMVMVPSRYKEFTSTLKALVTAGRVPIARIDDAVSRILTKKFEYGLFDHPYTDHSLTPGVGSQAHRDIARECVRQSLVLLKNERRTLPISKTVTRIHVAGKNADDIGNQCGGWTISWQGASGNTTMGTTVLQAIRNTVSSGTTVTFSRDGANAAGADIGIVVVGETPYAEGIGDRSDLSLSNEDVATIVRVKSTGIPVAVVLISGRPMIIEPVLGAVDAFVAAWLPGTEGQGVADVLFGDYRPTGKLSHSWPRDMSQIPVNQGDASYHPLLEYGFGLTY
jgi:beta-glucosidase